MMVGGDWRGAGGEGGCHQGAKWQESAVLLV